MSSLEYVKIPRELTEEFAKALLMLDNLQQVDWDYASDVWGTIIALADRKKAQAIDILGKNTLTDADVFAILDMISAESEAIEAELPPTQQATSYVDTTSCKKCGGVMQKGQAIQQTY